MAAPSPPTCRLPLSQRERGRLPLEPSPNARYNGLAMTPSPRPAATPLPEGEGTGADVAVPRPCLEGNVSALQGLRSDVEGAEDQEPPGGWIAPDGPLLVGEESTS